MGWVWVIVKSLQLMVKGVIGKQISYMTLTEVHSTMHLMHPDKVSCNYYVHVTTMYMCVCVCVCVCVREREREREREKERDRGYNTAI